MAPKKASAGPHPKTGQPPLLSRNQPKAAPKIATRAILERHAKRYGNQTYGTTAYGIPTAAMVAQKWAKAKGRHVHTNQQLLNQL